MNHFVATNLNKFTMVTRLQCYATLLGSAVLALCLHYRTNIRSKRTKDAGIMFLIAVSICM